jgi:hypothetical protein
VVGLVSMRLAVTIMEKSKILGNVAACCLTMMDSNFIVLIVILKQDGYPENY